MAEFGVELARAKKAKTEMAELCAPGAKQLLEMSGTRERKKARTSMFHLIFPSAGPDGRVACPLHPEHNTHYSGGKPHGPFKPDANGTGKYRRHCERWHPKFWSRV